MSYNQNFYNNFHGNTFQNAPYLPPPPLPPAFFIPPQTPWPHNDAHFLKQFEAKLLTSQSPKPKTSLSISATRNEIYTLLQKLKDLKSKETLLSNNINDLSHEEWNSIMSQIEESKEIIDKTLSNINHLNLEVLQKLINKRTAKRSRLKRLRAERKKEKEEWIKQMKEKSRKIDEKLQKIQDDIIKAKQEKDAKAQADIVLKETLRKKHDAKKYIVKLDALIKLRKARYNTAKGRGENVSENEADTFNNNIEKLKAMWSRRLSIYKNEEADLRAKLKEASGDIQLLGKDSKEVVRNLQMWQECLFGGARPQVDFCGDVGRFILVRSHWDEYLSRDGSSLPVGWVPPVMQVTEKSSV